MSKKQATATRPAKKILGKLCLVPGCNHKRVARGLCQACYVAMRLEVKSGRRTWTELERLGLALPAKKTGRPRSAAIHKALKKKTSKRAVKSQSAK